MAQSCIEDKALKILKAADLPSLRNHIIRKAAEKDAIHLAEFLRQEDKDEIKAFSGCDPLEGLLIVVNDGALVILDEDGPWAIWGNEGNTIWCLATSRLYDNRVAFLRGSSVWLEALPYTELECYTDSRNTEHHRWLEYNKFTSKRDLLFFSDPSVAFYRYSCKKG